MSRKSCTYIKEVRKALASSSTANLLLANTTGRLLDSFFRRANVTSKC
jgi:hypothetical protein